MRKHGNIKPTAQSSQTKTKKKGKLLILLAVGLAIAGVGILVLFNNKESSLHTKVEVQAQSVKYASKVIQGQFKIHERYEREPNQYTQCLMFKNSTHLLETSGLYEQSSVHFLQYDRQNEKISKPLESFNISVNYHNRIFAEGCTHFNDKVYVLSYKEREMMVLDSELKNVTQIIGYPGFIAEGWGLTHYEDSLIMSDGSNKIYFFNPDTFEIKKTLTVTGCKLSGRCTYFNELEVYKGYLLANSYFSNFIYVINMETGNVEKEYNMSYLAEEIKRATKDARYTDKGYVFNGIAFDENTDTLLVTGKFWPFIYKISLLDFPEPIQFTEDLNKIKSQP